LSDNVIHIKIVVWGAHIAIKVELVFRSWIIPKEWIFQSYFRIRLTTANPICTYTWVPR